METRTKSLRLPSLSVLMCHQSLGLHNCVSVSALGTRDGGVFHNGIDDEERCLPF